MVASEGTSNPVSHISTTMAIFIGDPLSLNFRAASLVIRMARTIIFPAGMRYQGELAGTAARMRDIGMDYRTTTLEEVTASLRQLQDATARLETALAACGELGEGLEAAQRYCADVLPLMLEVRSHADALETMVADDLWALPNYQEILFGK